MEVAVAMAVRIITRNGWTRVEALRGVALEKNGSVRNLSLASRGKGKNSFTGRGISGWNERRETGGNRKSPAFPRYCMGIKSIEAEERGRGGGQERIITEKRCESTAGRREEGDERKKKGSYSPPNNAKRKSAQHSFPSEEVRVRGKNLLSRGKELHEVDELGAPGKFDEIRNKQKKRNVHRPHPDSGGKP